MWTVLHSESRADPTGTVHGVIAGGAGYAQLSQLAAAMDVPCMTNNTFTAHEKTVSEAIFEAAMQTMAAAAAEESRTAEQRAEVDADGHGCIVVVTDGFRILAEAKLQLQLQL